MKIVASIGISMVLISVAKFGLTAFDAWAFPAFLVGGFVGIVWGSIHDAMMEAK